MVRHSENHLIIILHPSSLSHNNHLNFIFILTAHAVVHKRNLPHFSQDLETKIETAIKINKLNMWGKLYIKTLHKNDPNNISFH